MRQKGEARISVNKRLQTVFKVPPASNRAECLACVLGTLPLQALKMLLEGDAFTADFFPFFFLLFSLFYFLLLHRDAGRKQDSGESRESRAARGWGSWGGSRVYVLVCSKSRGFCSCPLLRSLLAARSMIIQPLVITA